MLSKFVRAKEPALPEIQNTVYLEWSTEFKVYGYTSVFLHFHANDTVPGRGQVLKK